MDSRVQFSCVSCTNVDRKMQVNSKVKSEVRFSFLKPLSQSSEVLTPPGDVISPKIDVKGPNWCFMYQH